MTHLQEKSKVEVGVGGGEGGKFMCNNITVPILHTAMRLYTTKYCHQKLLLYSSDSKMQILC